MMKNITVAVWGGSGAGKTTFSAALSQYLSSYFRSILLVNADRFSPAFAMWGVVPDRKKAEKENLIVESLGKAMNCSDLTADYLRQRIVIHPENKKIGLLSYLPDDDCERYDPIGGNAAQSLLNETKKFVQVTVIDCTNPQIDLLTEKALRYADMIIYLLEPNCRGVCFVNAQNSFIRRNLSDGRRYIFLAAKVDPESAVTQFEYLLGIRFHKTRLPYTEQARDKLNRLELFKKYNGEYGNTVDSIAKMIKEATVNETACA